MQDPPILDSYIVFDPNIESIILKIWGICFTQGGRKVLESLPHLYSWGYISVAWSLKNMCFLKKSGSEAWKELNELGTTLAQGKIERGGLIPAKERPLSTTESDPKTS